MRGHLARRRRGEAGAEDREGPLKRRQVGEDFVTELWTVAHGEVENVKRACLPAHSRVAGAHLVENGAALDDEVAFPRAAGSAPRFFSVPYRPRYL